ncbi:MAG: hypothetical protein LCH89_04985 [Proteobacteria bacterium]|jgi:predicted regulator of Ras-like GTPase activity (Roadblock/LC7/MglB family)|nr:hypothetical protein [Pseudomonadota bacterium]
MSAQQRLREALDAMGAITGLEGCALVEIDAGMVWHHAGRIEGMQTFAEAASDYWRLHRRLAGQFQDLGDLRASVLMHSRGRLAMLPCGTGMLLVTLTRQTADLDWAAWQRKAQELAVLVDLI